MIVFEILEAIFAAFGALAISIGVAVLAVHRNSQKEYTP